MPVLGSISRAEPLHVTPYQTLFLSLNHWPLQIRPRIGKNATILPRIANNRNVNWYPILSQRSTA